MCNVAVLIRGIFENLRIHMGIVCNDVRKKFLESAAPLASIDGSYVSPFLLLMRFPSILPPGKDFVPLRLKLIGIFSLKNRQK